MDPIIGTILIWPLNWAPQDWLICDGTVLSIQQHTALFSLIGTTYGGNGTTNFALPDLRGRMPIGMGQGNGLTNRTLGQMLGAETATLNGSNMPAHTHTLTAGTTPSSGLTQAPAANWTLGAAASVTGDRQPVVTPVNMYNANAATNPVQSAPTSVAGSGAAFGIMPPALCLNFIICINGIFPIRP